MMNQIPREVVHQETRRESILRTWASPTVLIAVITLFVSGVVGVVSIRNAIDTLSAKISAIDEAARAEMGRITIRIDALVATGAADMREVRDEQRALANRIGELMQRIGVMESIGEGLRSDVNRLLSLERMSFDPGGPR